ncbi:MAG: inner membrane protein [Acidobacteriota bacterium]|jgi:membrane-bound metal-dependent hydrolase YbcI (DUF457 family)|nr:inner membrane protein [Acidobacteriota bacterium]
MPLPIAHGFIGASIIAATLPGASSVRNWKLLLLGAALSVSPDLDYFLATNWHRGFTHSLIFAAGVSLVCFAVARLENIRMAIGCAVAIFSHGVLDFATTKTMPGVELLWPFTDRRFGLGLVDYYSLTGVDPVFFLGKDVWTDLLKMGMVELIIFFPIFLFVLSLKWSINNPSRS